MKEQDLLELTYKNKCKIKFLIEIYIYIFQNYSTIKKEILSIVLCISKFQSDLLNQKFLIRIDCISAKHVL